MPCLQFKVIDMILKKLSGYFFDGLWPISSLFFFFFLEVSFIIIANFKCARRL